jgi:hypothetical protein
MQGNKYRVLIVSSHPVRYAAPLYRLMAQHPKLDILVAYCSLQGAEKGVDPEFGVEVAWDVPLLEGYPSHGCMCPTDRHDQAWDGFGDSSIQGCGSLFGESIGMRS